MKTLGLIVPKSAGIILEGHIRTLLATNAGRERIALPMLDAWLAVRARVTQLSKQLIASGRTSERCQLLMSIPGIGVVTAPSFIATIEDPANFAKSRSVGAWIGLTTKRYQSGEVDYEGRISKRGDNHLRALLYEAAMVILTRTTANSALRVWGLKLREKARFKSAAIAVARKSRPRRRPCSRQTTINDANDQTKTNITAINTS
jgi:transposase